MDRNPPPDLEAEGFDLAMTYELALTRTLVHESIGDTWSDAAILAALEYYDARDDLAAWIEANGPVETEGGVYRLNALGTLSFAREHAEVQCPI